MKTNYFVLAACFGVLTGILVLKHIDNRKKAEKFKPPSVTVTTEAHTNGGQVVTVIVKHPPWTTTFVTNLVHLK